MANDPQVLAETVTAHVKLSGPDWELRTAMSVPKEPTQPRQLLPVVQAFADKVVDAAVQASEAQGQKISCKKGCGACCRQLVPISETEAHNIRDVVEALPEPRRAEIRARFAAARQKLETTGLLEQLQQPDREWQAGESVAFGLKYFAQGIPCPFLENGSCSIYADRPITCREYLVTSPAENCAKPTAQTIKGVPLPLKVWTAVARFNQVSAGRRFIRWVPLILAPEWAETHVDDTPARPGPELLQELFDHMKKTGSALTRLGETPTSSVQ